MGQTLGEFIGNIGTAVNQVGTYLNDVASVVRPNVDNKSFQNYAVFGVYQALCVDTKDFLKQNAVRFYNPLSHDPGLATTSLPFAYPISPFGGFDDSGANWVPPAGSTIMLVYEGGISPTAYYLGTIWNRDRGPNRKHNFDVPVPEYEEIYGGRRNGYLCGPNDGSQVLPPWNTESYNGYDVTSIDEIAQYSDLIKKMTYPNIYGFKTPEKHMVKMVDGDAQCNRKWKRLEIMSGNGNWLMFKDDHLHYAGQWAHPACGTRPGDTSCKFGFPNPQAQNFTDSNQLRTTNYSGDGESGEAIEKTEYLGDEQLGDCPNPKNIIGGKPDYPGKETQIGANPFFKNANECRPYKGPQTPQNNKCDLPQTGIQLLSISGHSFVMDDSVEEPRGSMEWSRSTNSFDFGCTDRFLGRSYWKSATGHSITMNDQERLGSSKKVRSEDNGILIKSALGNQIFLCDAETGPECPSVASELQGIRMQTTSNHTFVMSDNKNDRKYTCRKEGASPNNNASDAYIRLRTGFGCEMLMYDGPSQKQTGGQYIQFSIPQPDNPTRGDHIFRIQSSANENGLVVLRSGGDFERLVFGTDIELVGIEDNPDSLGNKISFVKNNWFEETKNTRYQKNNQYVTWSEQQTFVLSGRDYDQKIPSEQQRAEDALRSAGIDVPPKEKVPNVCPVLVFDGNRGAIVMSDRVFASASPAAPLASIFNLSPFNPKGDARDKLKILKNKINSA
jgi:hypothetical protein